MPAPFATTANLHVEGSKPPKPRSALGYYLILWVTGGLFMFVWLYLLMRDVNTLSGRRVLNAAVIAGSLFGTFLLYEAFVFGGGAALGGAFPPLWFFEVMITAAISLLLAFALSVTAVYRFAVLANGGRPSSIRLIGTTLLSFLWFASLPLTQAELNRAIRRSTPARA